MDDECMTWDNYFMNLAWMARLRSKDPNTKVGAIIVGPSKEVISSGYNGLPSGVAYKEHFCNRPYKYSVFEHAERNAIFLAARRGTSTLSAHIYSQLAPCVECSRAIIQSGIKRVVYDIEELQRYKETAGKFSDDFDLSRELFDAAGVKFEGITIKRYVQ